MTALGVAVFVVFVFASVSQVWADTVSPNPVIADQPFSISGVGGGGFGSLYHGSLCDNGGSVTAITAVFDPSSGPFTDNFLAQQNLSGALLHERVFAARCCVSGA